MQSMDELQGSKQLLQAKQTATSLVTWLMLLHVVH
jgi:hypothetical protein